MMLIDFHTHCYPEKVVAKALSAVQGRLEPATDGTRDGLIASMREAGIDYSLALGLVTNPANSLGVNRWAAEQNRAPVFFTGSIHPDDPDPETTLDFIADSGLKGIKLHPEYQRFEFSEERLFPLWERCCELGLFVVLMPATTSCSSRRGTPIRNDWRHFTAAFRNSGWYWRISAQ